MEPYDSIYKILEEAILRAKAEGIRVLGLHYGICEKNGVFVFNSRSACPIGCYLVGKSSTPPNFIENAAIKLNIRKEDVDKIITGFDLGWQQIEKMDNFFKVGTALYLKNLN